MPKRAPMKIKSAEENPAVITTPPESPIVKSDQPEVLRPGESGYHKIESGNQIGNQTISRTEKLNPDKI